LDRFRVHYQITSLFRGTFVILSAAAGAGIVAAHFFARAPLLVLSADDGLAPRTDLLVKAIGANGGQKVTSIHAATDHSWSDHRIFSGKRHHQLAGAIEVALPL